MATPKRPNDSIHDAFFKEVMSDLEIAYTSCLFVQNAEIAPEILHEKMTILPSIEKNQVMSTYDMLIEKGKIQGREEGIEQGIDLQKTTSTKNMIRKGLSDDIITDLLDVSVEFVTKIRKEIS